MELTETLDSSSTFLSNQFFYKAIIYFVIPVISRGCGWRFKSQKLPL